MSAKELKSKIQILIDDAISSEEEGDEILSRAEKFQSKIEIVHGAEKSESKMATSNTQSLSGQEKGADVISEGCTDVIVETSSEQAEASVPKSFSVVATGSQSPVSDVTGRYSESSISVLENEHNEKPVLVKNVELKMAEISSISVEISQCQTSPKNSVILSELQSATACDLTKNVEHDSIQSPKSSKNLENIDSMAKKVDKSPSVTSIFSLEASSVNVAETGLNSDDRISSKAVEVKRSKTESSDVLVGVLESLTEESAKEIFQEANKISEATSKVMKNFVGQISVGQISTEKVSVGKEVPVETTSVLESHTVPDPDDLESETVVSDR